MPSLELLESTNERYKVIVVDDDRSVADAVGAMLGERYEVSVTTAPAAVLKWVLQRDVHVVVSDWQMPAMDGVTLFRQMRRVSQPIGFLLMTGYIDEFRHEVLHEERRLLGLIVKPFPAAQLFERVDQLARIASMKRSVRMLKPVIPSTR
jgi:two-component system response regulator YesN